MSRTKKKKAGKKTYCANCHKEIVRTDSAYCGWMHAGTTAVTCAATDATPMPTKAKFSKEEIAMGLQLIDARNSLDAIASIIENVDNRCMAADGPVTATLREMTAEEIKTIYQLAMRHRQAGKPIEVFVSASTLPSGSREPKRKIKDDRPYYIHIKRGVQGFRLSYEGTKQDCEWYAHQLRIALSGGPTPKDGKDEWENEKLENKLQNAATLMRRLLYRVVKDNPALPRPAIVGRVNGWLRQEGLVGSPLRNGEE